MEDDFGPSEVAVVEVLVGCGGLFEWELVGDDHGRVGAAVVDEIHEASVVCLDVALAGADLLAFEPEFSEVECDLTFLGELVFGSWILRDEDADNAEDSGGFDGVDEGVHDEVWDFLACCVVTLVTDALCTAVGTKSVGEFANLIAYVAVLGVDGGGSDLFCEGEAVGLSIDNKDLAGSLNAGGHGSHKAYGARSVDEDGLARIETGETGGMPAGGKDVGEHDVVVLLFVGVTGEFEAVDVCIGDAEVLSLASCVWAHAGETVGRSCHARHDGGIGAGETVAGEASLAIGAETAGYVEGEDDFVTLLDGVDGFANLDDFSEVFVAENLSHFYVGAAFVHVEIGAADVGAGELDDDVGQSLEFRIGDGIDGDFFRAVIDKSFHGLSSAASLRAAIKGGLMRAAARGG